ncbi:MAG: hypothetical protein R2711_08675 [Acidimicrobiales bacterium]
MVSPGRLSLEPLDRRRERAGLRLVGGVEADPVHQVAEAAEQLVAHPIRLGHHGEGGEDVVVDQLAHLGPLPLLRQAVQLGLQLTPAVVLRGPAVGGGGAVEGDLLAHAGRSGRRLLLGGAGDHEGRQRELHVAPSPARGVEPAREGRYRDLAEVRLGGEPVAEHPVAHLADDFRHQLAHGGEEHLWGTELAGAGVEERRRHERVL